MKDFGSAKHPLRPSQLPYLVLCSWRAVAREMKMLVNESGAAADLGSAVHLAVAAFHKGAKEVDALATMRDASAAFPLADLKEAERIFSRYAEDPRNRDAKVVATEEKVSAKLNPHYLDGPEIVIEGTLDQVRLVGNTYEVWDLKTGIREGLYFQTVYCLQMAAYVVGARVKYPRAVAGGYIRTKAYFTRGAVLPSPANAFIPANIPDPDKLLDAVRWAVCCIRAGYVIPTPGEHCCTCPFQGVEVCLPKLAEYHKEK